MEALYSCSQFKNGDAKVSTSVYRNFSFDTIHVFIHQKTDKQSQKLFAIIKNQPIKLQMLVFCCKIRSTIWEYPGFRAIGQRHYMGISGIRSKQLRPGIACAIYSVSQARYGLKFKDDSLLARKYSSGQSVFQ